MKKFNISISLIVFIFSIFLGLVFWSLLNFNLKEKTDFVKFYIYIFISLAPSYYYITKSKENFISFFELKKLNFNYKLENNKNSLFFFFLVFIYIIAGFLNLELNNFNNIDLYHSGFSLTPSSNYLISKQFWNSTFIESGFYPAFKHLIFKTNEGNITIGFGYFLTYAATFLNKIFLIIILQIIVSQSLLNSFNKIIFFVFSTFFILNLSNYNGDGYFQERHLLFLIFLVLICFNFLKKYNNFCFLSSFLIGCVSVLSILWWFDIFLFINIFILFYILLLKFFDKKKQIIYISLSISIFLIIFFIFFPKNEIYVFLENNLYILTEINKYTYIEYPVPLHFDDGRALKTLIFFSYSGYLLLFVLFKKKIDFISGEGKIILLFIFVSSLICFLFGLGRSDSYHIKYSTGLLMLNLIIMHCYFFIFYLQKKFPKEKNFYLIPILIIVLIFKNEIDIKKIKNVPYFFKNSTELIKADNYNFFQNNLDYFELINYYNQLESSDNCVQVFTDETFIPYILNKKTCSKYFFYHILKSEKLQTKLIQDLKRTKPKFILFESDIFPFYNFSKDLNLVQEYIELNYSFHEKFLHWTFLKLK